MQDALRALGIPSVLRPESVFESHEAREFRVLAAMARPLEEVKAVCAPRSPRGPLQGLECRRNGSTDWQ